MLRHQMLLKSESRTLNNNTLWIQFCFPPHLLHRCSHTNDKHAVFLGWTPGGFGEERGIIYPFSSIELPFHNGSSWTCVAGTSLRKKVQGGYKKKKNWIWQVHCYQIQHSHSFLAYIPPPHHTVWLPSHSHHSHSCFTCSGNPSKSTLLGLGTLLQQCSYKGHWWSTMGTIGNHFDSRSIFCFKFLPLVAQSYSNSRIRIITMLLKLR